MYVQYRYLVFDPPGLGPRPGYTVLTKPNHTVYPGLGGQRPDIDTVHA